MPTAEDYRTGIARLDRRIDDIAAIQRTCDQYRDGFGYTGGVAPLIRTALIAAAANASSTGAECGALRSELDRRAGLCEEFTQQMRRYRWALGVWQASSGRYWSAPAEVRLLMYLPPRPMQPTPPFPGAEASP